MNADLTAASEASSIHKLAVETDTELGKLWAIEARYRDYAFSELDRLESGRSYRTDRERADAEARIEGYKTKVAECRVAAAPYESVYATYRWSRFFLCTASGGHIHNSTACSTTFVRTQFNWLPELSGLTEAEAVEAYGEILCSVCFPSAPVAWTSGVSKATRAERAERDAKKAERAAKKAAKALFPTDPDLGIKVEHDTIKTIAAAKSWLTDAFDWNASYPRTNADGSLSLHHPSFSPEHVDLVATALAARTDEPKATVLAAAQKRAAKRGA